MSFRELFCTFSLYLWTLQAMEFWRVIMKGILAPMCFIQVYLIFLWIASHQEWIWLVLTSFRMGSVFHWIFRQPSLFEIFYWSLSTFSPGVRINPTLQQTFLRSQKERKRTFCQCHSYLALPSGYTLVIKSSHMIWPTSLQFLSFLRYLIGFQIPLLRQDGSYLLWGGNGQTNMKDIHSSSVKKHLSSPETPRGSGWSHSSCHAVIRSTKILVNLYLERWN